MRARHWDILEEIEYITEYDGFVDTCLDLRDSMLFYDKGLILASYSSTLELLISLAYMWASLSSSEADEVFEAAESVIDNLARRLYVPDMPIDVRVMVDSFFETGGWIIKERMPLLRAMFTKYMNNDYRMSDNINEILRQAQLALGSSEEEALDLVARAGAMALRGERVRPAWLNVLRGQLQVWVRGIMNVVSSFAAAPHFSFPFDEVERERKKWVEERNPQVQDLKAFRNRRYALASFDYVNERVLETDEIDEVLSFVFSGLSKLTREMVGTVSALRPIRPLLQAIVETRELQTSDAPGAGLAPIHAVRLLAKHPVNSVIDTLIDTVLCPQNGQALVKEAAKALSHMGEKAAGRIVLRIGSVQSDQAKVILADTLVETTHSETVLRTLLNLYQGMDEEQSKVEILRALVSYGDPQAIPVLEEELVSHSCEPTTPLSQHLRWAIAQLKKPGVKKPGGEEPPRSVALPRTGGSAKRRGAKRGQSAIRQEVPQPKEDVQSY